MTDLRPPYNWWRLEDGEEQTLTPVRYEAGRPQIAPLWSAPGTRPEMLRVWLPSTGPDALATYVDLSQQRLIATLTPILATVAGTGRRLRVRASGAPPRTEYSVTVEPA